MVFNRVSSVKFQIPYSISYTKINFVVEIDMQKGFQSASATVTEDAPEENNQNTQIDYNGKYNVID